MQLDGRDLTSGLALCCLALCCLSLPGRAQEAPDAPRRMPDPADIVAHEKAVWLPLVEGLVSSSEAYIDLIQHLDAFPRYPASREAEYLAHLENVFRQNMRTLREHPDRDTEPFKEAVGKYFPFFTHSDPVDLYRVQSLGTAISKLILYAEYTTQVQLHLDNGIDLGELDAKARSHGADTAIGLLEAIADNSRPEPFVFGDQRFADVDLMITVDEPSQSADYWPNRTVDLELVLSNARRVSAQVGVHRSTLPPPEPLHPSHRTAVVT